MNFTCFLVLRRGKFDGLFLVCNLKYITVVVVFYLVL